MCDKIVCMSKEQGLTLESQYKKEIKKYTRMAVAGALGSVIGFGGMTYTMIDAAEINKELRQKYNPPAEKEVMQAKKIIDAFNNNMNNNMDKTIYTQADMVKVVKAEIAIKNWGEYKEEYDIAARAYVTKAVSTTTLSVLGLFAGLAAFHLRENAQEDLRKEQEKNKLQKTSE